MAEYTWEQTHMLGKIPNFKVNECTQQRWVNTYKHWYLKSHAIQKSLYVSRLMASNLFEKLPKKHLQSPQNLYAFLSNPAF